MSKEVRLKWKQEAEQMKASAEIAAQAMDGANPCDMPEWQAATKIIELCDAYQNLWQYHLDSMRPHLERMKAEDEFHAGCG